MLPRNPAEFGPQGDQGVEQSPNPVLPNREVAPVAGSIAIRSPVKARVNKGFPGLGTKPTPASCGCRPGPIGANAPLRKSSTPNCTPFVTTYTRRLGSLEVMTDIGRGVGRVQRP